MLWYLHRVEINLLQGHPSGKKLLCQLGTIALENTLALQIWWNRQKDRQIIVVRQQRVHAVSALDEIQGLGRTHSCVSQELGVAVIAAVGDRASL